MKHFKSLIIYVSILSLVLVTIFTSNPLKVYADVPSSQKVISHGSSWGTYDFIYSLQRKYFTIEDSTGIPVYDGTPRYFYTDDNETFFILDGAKLFTVVLNRGVGITVKNDLLTTMIQAFFSKINIRDRNGNTFIQGGLYDGNNNFLGYCLNDITGCYYQGVTGSPDINIPSETTNNVHNFYKYYIDDNKTVVDYFTFVCPSNNYISQKWDGYNESTQNQLSNFVTLSATTDNLLMMDFHYNNGTFDIDKINTSHSTLPQFVAPSKDDTCYIYTNQTTGSNWNNFCTNLDLINDNHELLFTDLIEKIDTLYMLSTGYFIAFDVINPTDGTRKNAPRYTTRNTIGDIGESTAPTPRFNFGIKQDYMNTYTNLRVPTGKNITIYKDYATFTAVNKDKTYYPNSYPSTIYYNYNPNTDNGFTVNIGSIDNSTTNNTTIYNYGNDSYDENREDNGVNTPDISNDITIIIENVIEYPGGNPGPDPGPNPNPNPDDDNPLDDDTILDSILAALKRFFDVIGRILGTVLAGLLEVIDSLLESIAGIMDNLTGLTEFIASLFSWIPSPVPEILAVGFSICVLAAIIKFIRG